MFYEVLKHRVLARLLGSRNGSLGILRPGGSGRPIRAPDGVSAGLAEGATEAQRSPVHSPRCFISHRLYSCHFNSPSNGSARLVQTSDR